MTRSPTANLPLWPSVPSPTSSTTPKNSWPGMTGGFTQGLSPQNILAPDQHLQSLAQMPQAWTLITSSPGPGLGRSTCSTR